MVMGRKKLYTDEELKQRRHEAYLRYKERHPGRQLIHNKKWRKANPELYAEIANATTKAWNKRFPGMATFYAMRRYAAKLKRTPPWVNWKAIEWYYTQKELLNKLTGIEHEVDHTVPLQGDNVSGLHVHDNMWILTKTENREKSNKFGCEHGNCGCYPPH